jgi:hypothetical protein
MNTWQDWILAICIFALNVALLPSLWGVNKPRLATCLLTALFLIPQIVVYLSLSLWYSFVMVLINTLLWLILAVQNIRRSRKIHAR